AVHIGVHTGEVVTGEGGGGEGLVAGDAVNVAARLEQAAAPGEILLGELTYRLVRNAVEAEWVEPIAAKGKSELVGAYRVRGVQRAKPLGTPSRAPMIGRQRELEQLQTLFSDTVGSRSCRVCIVVGDPGVGKSR